MFRSTKTCSTLLSNTIPINLMCSTIEWRIYLKADITEKLDSDTTKYFRHLWCPSKPLLKSLHNSQYLRAKTWGPPEKALPRVRRGVSLILPQLQSPHHMPYLQLFRAAPVWGKGEIWKNPGVCAEHLMWPCGYQLWKGNSQHFSFQSCRSWRLYSPNQYSSLIQLNT